MDDLVSIIMPSFNTGRFIAESITSVINQTYQNWELIIVDDCSTDNTDIVVSSFSDKRIRYLKNDKNSGAAFSRNKALKEASGRWIAFLDSDDVWSAEKLEKQVKFMIDNGYVFTYSGYERINELSESLGKYCTGPKIITTKKMYNYCYPGCLTVMYDSFKVGLIQIKNIKKNNDYAMWLIISKKYNCYLINDNLAKYRVRKSSISHDSFIKKIKSHYDLFRHCEEKTAFISFLFTTRNIWHGFWKKIRFEKRIKSLTIKNQE